MVQSENIRKQISFDLLKQEYSTLSVQFEKYANIFKLIIENDLKLEYFLNRYSFELIGQSQGVDCTDDSLVQTRLMLISYNLQYTKIITLHTIYVTNKKIFTVYKCNISRSIAQKTNYMSTVATIDSTICDNRLRFEKISSRGQVPAECCACDNRLLF